MLKIYNINKLKGRLFTASMINLKNKEEANIFFQLSNILESNQLKDIYYYDTAFYTTEDSLLELFNTAPHLTKDIDISKLKPINVRKDKLETPNCVKKSDLLNFLKLKTASITHNTEKGVATLQKKHGHYLEELKNLKNFKKIGSIDFEYVTADISGLREIGYIIKNQETGKTISNYIIIDKFYKKRASTKTESVRLEKMNDTATEVKIQILPLKKALEKVYNDLSSCDCIMGHNLKTELKILQTRFPEAKKLDSQYLFSLIEKEANFFSLEKILKRLNIKHKLLHNAFNDAYYTLEVIEKLYIQSKNNQKISKKRKKTF